MRAVERGGGLAYASARLAAERPYVFEGSYRPVGTARQARRGTLEHFLVERYCHYAADAGDRLYRAEIHHLPWPLRRAEARIELNTMLPDGISLPDEPPLLHFSERQDVLIWPLEPVAP